MLLRLEIVPVLRMFRRGRAAVVTAAAATSGDGSSAALRVVDRDGHAYAGYEIEGGRVFVVVRPDGMIGAFAREVDAYFANVISAF